MNAAPKRIFLRVVSRVYFARAIDVSLSRSGSQGASGKGGTVNDVSLVTTNGSTNPEYTNVLSTLSGLASAAASTVSNMTQVGAAVKFVSASKSTVGLSQTFDHLLAIGYLGFDLEVGTNGYPGVPIPTFQHQTGKIPTPSARPSKFGVDENSIKIRGWLRTLENETALKKWLGEPLVNKFGLTQILDTKEFSDLRSEIVFQIQHSVRRRSYETPAR